MTDAAIRRHVARYPTVALVLQGGGALGAYQCGVYERLHEAGIAPNWFAGISIGAINAAILAGNVLRDSNDLNGVANSGTILAVNTAYVNASSSRVRGTSPPCRSSSSLAIATTLAALAL